MYATKDSGTIIVGTAISLVIILTLGLSVCRASDMALYTGNPSWYDKVTMLQDAEKIVAEVGGTLEEVKTFNDEQLEDLEAWGEANLDDDELDIIWLPGSTPSVLYPLPDLKPDGSLAEEWVNHGNMIINLGDWFACLSFETGVIQRNDANAAVANILGLPGIIQMTDNLKVTITPTGEKYLPSATDFISDRALQLGVLKDPWEVAAVFASPSGQEDDTQADPVVIHNTETEGYFAIIAQTLPHNALDRGAATIEFINNWVSEIIASSAVESHGKLAATWGELKR